METWSFILGSLSKICTLGIYFFPKQWCKNSLVSLHFLLWLMFYYEIYCLLFQLMFRLLGISSDLVLAYFQGFQRIYSELSQILKKKNWGFFYDHIPNFCKCSMCLFSQNCKNLVNFVNFLMLVNHQLFYTLIHFISAYFVSKWKWCVEVFHHFCRFIYSFFGF